MKTASRDYKTLADFGNPDTAHPARRVIDREIKARSFYAEECQAERDSLIYVLSSEMRAGKGRALPNDKQRIGIPIRSVRAGEVCRISECRDNFICFMNEASEPVRYLQLLIKPSRDIGAVTHQAVSLDELEQRNHLRLVASADGRSGSMTVHSNVDVYLASLRNGELLQRESESRNGIFIHVVKGCVEMGQRWLWPFDRPVIAGGDDAIELVGRSDDTEVLLVETA